MRFTGMSRPGVLAGLVIMLWAAAPMAASASSACAVDPPPVNETPTPATAPATDDDVQRITIPLADGRLDFAEVLRGLAVEFGLDESAVPEKWKWDLNVERTVGRLPLYAVATGTDDVIRFEVESDRVIMSLDRAALRREESQLRSRFGQLLRGWFPEEFAAAEARYGIFVCGADGTRTRLRNSDPKPTGHVIVLVHGVDDPGVIWTDLRPALLEAKYSVCELDYPNDQPIVDSARMLAEGLTELRQAGVDRVTLIGHSMGGLVCREVLTSAAYYGGDMVGGERYPGVVRLIMVATPNQGSPLAGLRLLAEARDQFVRAINDRPGDGGWLAPFLDGMGEAGVDLRPRSDFLQALNARPMPEGLPVTIIAGDRSPLSEMNLQRIDDEVRPKLREGVTEHWDRLIDSLGATIDGTGDGAVPVDSTRLAGVDDYVLVRANHVSIIRSPLGTKSDEVPPAIPVILERLRKDR